MSGRSCGSCSACCTTLGIRELEKPAGVRCPHLREGTHACGRYDTRPAECGRYACGWLQGFGGNEDRPDRLGLLFDVAPAPDGGDHMVLVRELRAGALESTRGRKLCDQVREQTVLVTVLDGHRNLSGPDHRVTACLRTMTWPDAG